MKYIHADFPYVFYPVGENINDAIKYIDSVIVALPLSVKKSPINLWVRGSSGAILGGLFAKSLQGNIIRIYHVKKEKEYAHHNYIDYMKLNREKNIILDDFCDTGTTIDVIYTEVKEHIGKRTVDYIIISKMEKKTKFFKC